MYFSSGGEDVHFEYSEFTHCISEQGHKRVHQSTNIHVRMHQNIHAHVITEHVRSMLEFALK